MIETYISERFKYHTPNDEQKKLIEDFGISFSLMEMVIETINDSREKSLALTKLEETAMWVKKAVFK